MCLRAPLLDFPPAITPAPRALPDCLEYLLFNLSVHHNSASVRRLLLSNIAFLGTMKNTDNFDVLWHDLKHCDVSRSRDNQFTCFGYDAYPARVWKKRQTID